MVQPRFWAHFANRVEALPNEPRIWKYFDAFNSPERGQMYAESVRAVELTVYVARHLSTNQEIVGTLPVILDQVENHLPKMKNLNGLNLAFWPRVLEGSDEICRGLLESVKGFPLKYLSLAFIPSGDSFASCLSSWKELENFVFEGGVASDEEIGKAMQAAPTSIRSVRIGRKVEIRHAMELISRLENLEDLVMCNLPNELEPELYAVLKKRKETLKTLDMGFKDRVGNMGLKLIGADVAALIETCSELEDIAFTDIDFQDEAGIEALSKSLGKMEKLKSVGFFGNRFPGRDISHKLWLPEGIERIAVDHCQSKTPLDHLLQQTPELKWLEVHDERVESEDWLALAKNGTKLEYLNLRRTVLRSWQVMDIVENFLPNLKWLILPDAPELSRFGRWVQKLREKWLRPGLEISFPDAWEARAQRAAAGVGYDPTRGYDRPDHFDINASMFRMNIGEDDYGRYPDTYFEEIQKMGVKTNYWQIDDDDESVFEYEDE